MVLSAFATVFIPGQTTSPPTSTPTSPSEDRISTSPGYKLMLKMGWSPGTPLGIRGEGITSPVEATFRHDKDYRGIGFEEIHTEEDEVEKVAMKITRISPNYIGTGASNYGDVYIPTSSLRHIKNIGKLSSSLQLRDIYVSGIITKTDKKLKWRLNEVSEVLGYLCDFAHESKWCGPYIQ